MIKPDELPSRNYRWITFKRHFPVLTPSRIDRCPFPSRRNKTSRLGIFGSVARLDRRWRVKFPPCCRGLCACISKGFGVRTAARRSDLPAPEMIVPQLRVVGEYAFRVTAISHRARRRRGRGVCCSPGSRLRRRGARPCRAARSSGQAPYYCHWLAGASTSTREAVRSARTAVSRPTWGRHAGDDRRELREKPMASRVRSTATLFDDLSRPGASGTSCPPPYASFEAVVDFLCNRGRPARARDQQTLMPGGESPLFARCSAPPISQAGHRSCRLRRASTKEQHPLGARS